MSRSHKNNEDGPFSELAIVDTFTKLIFGEEEGYDPRELSIIQALRTVDANVLADSHGDMGDYLRALGVREMVHLVARVREHLVCGLSATTSDAASRVPGGAVGPGVL